MPVYSYTTIDDPLGVNGTVASGINDAGQIVGNYTDNNGRIHGFRYSNGTFTTLNDPSAGTFVFGTLATGINNAGQIVGWYNDNGNVSHGFLYSGGIYFTLDDPRQARMTAGHKASTARARSSVFTRIA